jgi:predicted heme/steroid binding protein/YHS domain-containing protein
MRISAALLSMLLLAVTAAALDQKKPDDAWKARVFTSEGLRKYNGKNGMPVYVAVDGIVYDLSRVGPWKTGRHMNMHNAGEDHSDDIHNKAPKSIHKGGKILEKLPKVGVMEGYQGAIVAGEKAAPEKEPLAAMHKVTKDEVGKAASCPVTGKKLLVAEGTPALELKGKVYYFADELSLGKFKENPGKYLGGLKDNAKRMLKKV